MTEGSHSSTRGRDGSAARSDARGQTGRKRNPPASDRREQIVAAARELYNEQGLSKTTVTDITQRVGISRSLFYHYFPNKDAVTSAVIDGYVDDYVEALRIWNEQRTAGDIEGALASFIHIGRTSVFENDDLHKALATRENAALYLELMSNSADRLARYVSETTVKDYEARHTVEIDHVYESLYVLIYGLVGYVRAYPDADEAMLVDIVVQSLHMVRGTQDADAPGDADAAAQPAAEQEGGPADTIASQS